MPTQIGVKNSTVRTSQQRALLIAAALCLLLQTAGPAAADHHTRQAVLGAQLQTQLAAIPAPSNSAAAAIQNFYRERGYAPAWLNTKRLMELGQLGRLAELHGLEADAYRLTEFSERINQLLYSDSNEELARLDLIATGSVARLALHLRQGKVDPVGRYASLRAADDVPLTLELLTDAAASASLFAYLNSLPPDTLLYRKLQLSLTQHRALLEQDTVWPLIADGRTLEPGMTDPRMPALRQRLGLPTQNADPEVYDEELAAAVAGFQGTHMLTDDGMLGHRTLAALNVSLRNRIDQLRVNLEWQRWATMSGDTEYLQVNIAHYKMHWVKDGERIWSARTQVGKRKRPTPTFKSAVSAITANPDWTVPPTIFREDLLPRLQTEPDFLSAQGMYVVDRWGQPVDSSTIDWEETNAADFPYWLRAQPGATNALGRMKFLLPNPYSIYMHDTPSKHLFEREARNYSSGCIRIEQPERLAESLMARESSTKQEQFHTALGGERTKYISLERPMPIVVMYGTVDLDNDGNLIFARDVYGKDRQVLWALDSVQPSVANFSLAEAR